LLWQRRSRSESVAGRRRPEPARPCCQRCAGCELQSVGASGCRRKAGAVKRLACWRAGCRTFNRIPGRHHRPESSPAQVEAFRSSLVIRAPLPASTGNAAISRRAFVTLRPTLSRSACRTYRAAPGSPAARSPRPAQPVSNPTNTTPYAHPPRAPKTHVHQPLTRTIQLGTAFAVVSLSKPGA
jgi:hypothetical protein